jgi:hypothetical protein
MVILTGNSLSNVTVLSHGNKYLKFFPISVGFSTKSNRFHTNTLNLESFLL